MIWHTDLKTATVTSTIWPSPRNVIEQKDESKKSTKKFKDLMRLYWQQYCKKSTINGVRYIYDPSLGSVERLIWGALVITCVTLTCIGYAMLQERYSLQKMKTILASTQFPVYKIAFPAVGVCTRNRINWQRFEAAKTKFLPATADPNVVHVFTSFVERMESLGFGQFEGYGEMDDVNLELLDDIDVTKLAEFMALRCEDIIVNGSCTWRRQPFNCCAALVMERTEYGYCLVFNSILSSSSLEFQKNYTTKFYPFHNSKSGQGSGLNFDIILNENMLRPNSKLEDTVTILVKSSGEISNLGYTISPFTETYVIIQPEKTETDENIRSLNLLKRNCLFEDETDRLHYKMQSKFDKDLVLSNCLNICHEDHIRKYCNCTLPLFFLSTDPKVEQCRASHFRCLAKHNDIFSYDKRLEEDAHFSAAKPGMTCSCFIPCNFVEYYTSLATLPLADMEILNNDNISYYRVDVHYQSEILIKYHTSLEFTDIDFIANFGGIFGLCLGASLVSAVELFYYLTFGFGLYLYDNNYFVILKQHFKDLRSKWTSGISDTINEQYTDGGTLKRKSSFLGKRLK